jgi:hypothetical protein
MLDLDLDLNLNLFLGLIPGKWNLAPDSRLSLTKHLSLLAGKLRPKQGSLRRERRRQERRQLRRALRRELREQLHAPLLGELHATLPRSLLETKLAS